MTIGLLQLTLEGRAENRVKIQQIIVKGKIKVLCRISYNLTHKRWEEHCKTDHQFR